MCSKMRCNAIRYDSHRYSSCESFGKNDVNVALLAPICLSFATKTFSQLDYCGRLEAASLVSEPQCPQDIGPYHWQSLRFVTGQLL
jgi:hypothetical protein